MDRRDVLRWLAASAAGAAVGDSGAFTPDGLFRLGRRVHAEAAQPTSAGGTLGAFRVLDRHGARTVSRAADLIIPTDDTPGAAAVAIERFVDRMLADWYSPDERERLLAGLRELDVTCQARHRAPFVACTPPQQTAVLESFDAEVAALRAADHVANVDAPDAHWFAMLKFLTIWGFFTSEIAARDVLGEVPRPNRHDPCAPYPAGPAEGGRR